MPHEPKPISLSDDAMDQIMRLTAPLAPPDRVALVNSLAALLKSEPVQPPGDGIVYRHVRALLSSGAYKRSATVAVGAAAPRPPNDASFTALPMLAHGICIDTEVRRDAFGDSWGDRAQWLC
jgi:hypothetical protein